MEQTSTIYSALRAKIFHMSGKKSSEEEEIDRLKSQLKSYQAIAKFRAERITRLERQLSTAAPDLQELQEFRQRKIIRFVAALTLPFEKIVDFQRSHKSTKWFENSSQ